MEMNQQHTPDREIFPPLENKNYQRYIEGEEKKNNDHAKFIYVK